MEFRLFLPMLKTSDKLWMSEYDLTKYSEILGKLRSMVSSSHEEVRSDTYIVAPAHMGLKYRHGHKLELKVRAPLEDSTGMEYWTKFSLGAREISFCESDIIHVLNRSGYPTDVLGFTLNETIELRKCRQQSYISSLILYEVCTIEVNSKSCENKRQWLSIAIEGNPGEMRKILFSKEDKYHIQAAILNIHKIVEPVIEDAIQNDCVPLVSGYPQFVRYISGKFSTEEIRTGMWGSWEALKENIEK